MDKIKDQEFFSFLSVFSGNKGLLFVCNMKVVFVKNFSKNKTGGFKKYGTLKWQLLKIHGYCETFRFDFINLLSSVQMFAKTKHKAWK